MTDRAEYIKGLRALADILEAHPGLPLPYQGSSPHYARLTFSDFLISKDPRANMAAARRALGVPMEKGDHGEYFDLTGTLHGLYFKLTAFRKDVCERVVTGTREVVIEEPGPASVAALPKVARVQVVEDVEWRCHPLLASDVEQVPAVAQ
ncbi:hypothetical protein [Streptosporangium sp. NPDC006007]|uniref:hypothetical protein n=1 Tax=Streptosporangium sp. NPDC006007 TaxID=3154575 RepID=UPI0033B4EAC3